MAANTITATLPDGTTEELEIGIYFDSAHGRYIGEAVQNFAIDMGWEGDYADADDEFYDDAWQEAEDYLNDLITNHESYFFGSTENGDWGLLENEEVAPLMKD